MGYGCHWIEYLQNVRAFSMVAEETLHGFIQDEPLQYCDDFIKSHEPEASKRPK